MAIIISLPGCSNADKFTQEAGFQVNYQIFGVIFLVLGALAVWRHLSVIRLNQQLGRAEERFQDLTTNIPGVVYQFKIDAEGESSFPYVSPTIRNVLGLDSGDIIKDPDTWLKQTHPEDRPGLDASIIESHTSLDSWKWEGRMIRASGEVGWFRGASEPTRLSDGSTLWNGIFLDITDFKTVESYSRDQQALINALIEYSPLLLSVKDLDGRYSYVSETYTHYLSVPSGRAIGAVAADILHPVAAAKLSEMDQVIVDSGAPLASDQVFTTKFGASTLQVTKFPIKDAAGHVIAVGTIGIDVTELIETEERLNQQTKLLKDAELLANFGHWEVRPKTGELFWSDEVYRIHGLEVGDEVDIDAAIEAYHPDDRDKVAAYVGNAIEKGEDFEFELRLLRADGELRHVKSVGTVRKGDDGTVESVFGIFQDINQLVEARDKLVLYQENLEKMIEERTRKLEESEEKFSKFYSIVPDVFMVTDLRYGICIDVNEGFSRISGYSREEAIGKRTIDLHLWEHDNERDRLVTGLADHGAVNNLEAQFRRKDGTIWYGMMSACVVRTGDDGFVLSATKDITEIEESRNEAIAANRAKSDFLSSMSHELRTPMNAILGFAQLLKLKSTETLSEKQKTYVEHILNGGNYLLELIDQVLELNRIEAGKLVLNINHASARNIIDECLRLIRTRADEEGVEIIDQSVGLDIPVLRTDSTRLTQVLLNLLSNAVKYNCKDGTVTLSCQEVPEEMLRIIVEDTGAGISLENQDKLFKPFERLGRESGNIEGTGIGLTITKQIIELLGGQIGYESTKDKGSTFWVDVPISNNRIVIETKTDVESEDTLTDESENDDGIFNTILYIEDNPANLSLMESIINGFQKTKLLSSPTAEQGLELARTAFPNLILMDINLPGMSGIEAMKRLQEKPETKNIPVVAITALAMPRDVEMGKLAGFRHYITKPFDIPELIGIIEQELDT